jgi:hypothetical protein
MVLLALKTNPFKAKRTQFETKFNPIEPVFIRVPGCAFVVKNGPLKW